ncbi:MAG: hypothetical protein IJO47_03005 [Clostridia bacterium]|nr:hypothetical protein [Clostridia bacterium]
MIFSEYELPDELSNLRLSDISGGIASFVGLENDTIIYKQVDIFSGDTMAEKSFAGYTYMASPFVLNGFEYVLGAFPAGAGLNFHIIDLTNDSVSAKYTSSNMPFTATVSTIKGGTAFITASANNGDIIYRFDGNSLTESKSYKYTVSNDGKFRGEKITAMGSLDEQLYIQLSKPKNQFLHDAETEILSYNFDFELVGTYKSKEIFNYISGDNDIIIASCYGYPEPLLESGRLYDLAQSSVYTLKNVQSGKDVTFSAKLNDYYFIFTSDGITVFDKINKTIKEIPGEIISPVCGDTIAYLSNGKLCTIDINNAEFSEDFSSEERAKLSYSLVNPYISQIYRDEALVYYIEMSDYAHRPLQISDIVFWKYDAASDTCVKLHQTESIMICDITASKDEISYTTDKTYTIKVN